MKREKGEFEQGAHTPREDKEGGCPHKLLRGCAGEDGVPEPSLERRRGGADGTVPEDAREEAAPRKEELPGGGGCAVVPQH